MNTDVILTQLATSALQGVIEGLEECAEQYGRETKLSIGDVIELLQACVDAGITPPDRHLHSVKAPSSLPPCECGVEVWLDSAGMVRDVKGLHTCKVTA